MRVTVSHHQPKAELKQIVDQSFDDLFRGVAGMPLQIANERRQWDGDILTFSFTAKMGFMGSPIKGTVEITETELTVDADLGLLEKLIPAQKAKTAIETKVRGLLA